MRHFGVIPFCEAPKCGMYRYVSWEWFSGSCSNRQLADILPVSLMYREHIYGVHRLNASSTRCFALAWGLRTPIVTRSESFVHLCVCMYPFYAGRSDGSRIVNLEIKRPPKPLVLCPESTADGGSILLESTLGPRCLFVCKGGDKEGNINDGGQSSTLRS
ncbi:hypothetical protein BKA93DRAFT_199569 [Sparassis latifolia]